MTHAPHRVCPAIRALARGMVTCGVFFGFLVAPLLCAAADVSMDVQPRALRAGEAAILSITVRGAQDAPVPTLPSLPSFQTSYVGTERSFTMGTGGTGSSITYRFQLVPLQAGKFTIGPFPYTVNGQTLTLPAVDIEVIAADANPAESNQPQQISDLVFAVLSASPSSVYNQQVFDIYLSIYSRGLNLSGEISLMNMPSSGLSLQQFQELPGTREVVRNQIYDVKRFQCKAQALTAGSFKLQPTIRIGIRVQDRRRSADPFQSAFDDPFFDNVFGRSRTHPIDITPRPLEIIVTDLPTDGQPAGYGGAVGSFAFDAFAKPSELAVGEPLTLTLRVSGIGNIDSITSPSIAAGDGFKMYEPKLVQSDVNPSQSEGLKVFEHVMIPRSTNVTEIPAVTFSFFDPSEKAYRTLPRGPFTLKVSAASNTTARMIQSSGSPIASAVTLGTDIVYLKPAPRRWRHVATRPWYTGSFFLALQSLPPLVTALVFLVTRRRQELERDVAKARRHRAPKVARHALRRAEHALRAGQRRQFFEAMWETLVAYFGNRLNLSPGELTLEAVLVAMEAASAPASLKSDVQMIFSSCDVERFGTSAPDEGSGTGPEEQQQLRDLLDRLYRTLRAAERVRL